MITSEPLRNTPELAEFQEKSAPSPHLEPEVEASGGGAGEPAIDDRLEIGATKEPTPEIHLEPEPGPETASATEAAAAKNRSRRRSKKERMDASHPEILDVEGAAKVMGVSRWLVLRLAREGKVPGKKVGKEWRFKLSNLLRWVGEPEMKEFDPNTPEGLRQLLNNPRAKFRPGGLSGG